MSDETHRFPERLAVRVPQGFAEALEVAARQQFTTASEWHRQALLRCLSAAGVRVTSSGEQEGHRG